MSIVGIAQRRQALRRAHRARRRLARRRARARSSRSSAARARARARCCAASTASRRSRPAASRSTARRVRPGGADAARAARGTSASSSRASISSRTSRSSATSRSARRITNKVPLDEAKRDRASTCCARSASRTSCDAYPAQLSGGQQQRVAIARALAMPPRLMLFDEITSALDPELIGEVVKVLERLATSGMTMLLVTHEMGFARRTADTLVFMHQGRVWEKGRRASCSRRRRPPSSKASSGPCSNPTRSCTFAHASSLHDGAIESWRSNASATSASDSWDTARRRTSSSTAFPLTVMGHRNRAPGRRSRREGRAGGGDAGRGRRSLRRPVHVPAVDGRGRARPIYGENGVLAGAREGPRSSSTRRPRIRAARSASAPISRRAASAWPTRRSAARRRKPRPESSARSSAATPTSCARSDPIVECYADTIIEAGALGAGPHAEAR